MTFPACLFDASILQKSTFKRIHPRFATQIFKQIAGAILLVSGETPHQWFVDVAPLLQLLSNFKPTTASLRICNPWSSQEVAFK
jgi:hypothetical protein